MKSIILSLVFMVILSSCTDMGFPPPEDPGVFAEKYCYYTARVDIITENGKPCTTAVVEDLRHGIREKADSLGHVYIKHIYGPYILDAPESQYFDCKVYKYPGSFQFVKCRIEVKRYFAYPPLSEWGPIIEVVIPDFP